MSKLRIVFLGTPEFAVAGLNALYSSGYNVAGVVTAPDKPAGRGRQLSSSAVKQYALDKGIKVLQPANLKDPLFIEELRNLNADLQIVIAFRMLPETVWNMPRLGTYNLHASLLPKYRGAAPINWAIINGENETGVTTFKLKHEIDTGNILFSEKVRIGPQTTAGELHDTLMHTGSALILKTVNKINECDEEGREPDFVAQLEELACHAPKIYKDTCKVNWNKGAREIFNLIRGLSPYPAAYTELHRKNQKSLAIKILTSTYELKEGSYTNGSLSTDNKTSIKVRCNDGWIEIKELQMEGKRRLNVEEFLRGFHFEEGDFLF